ncbi:MAG: asparagine--tRNA ligase [Bacteroidales bacterium]|nr:asparagine--tRNA ligase [Bacteroidaceae bacterium]MBR2161248.1 asparagine--tRNA ligase [Bacteroidaceae bacterium]MBR3014278.1 asparagine--tRNA ligase [Bacteroidaceae bacterium]MBR3626226.1 asparagine--tRNA ligase [Bacteroidaceae bacterium]MDO4185421.1 asparagine--tRNA ligase [Bacteroidales bacterium]
MESIRRTKIVDLLKREDFGAMVNVKGWVRTRRGSKQVAFIALNDGSVIYNVQVVVDLANFDENLLKDITTGACLSVNGELVQSVGSGQKVEIQAREIEVLGKCDNTYPLQKKGHSFEFLREIAHLRMRTNTFGAVFRIRHNMAIAIHKYFHEHGFFYFNSPIITASDCEGAGEMFQVTTKNLYDLKKDENGKIIYDDDFFGKMTSLTVSGQLEGETAATALGAIYTFGPTFRAENSNTPRHLAEFWMVEPEVAFCDLNDLMDLEEDFIKYCVQWALDNCMDDLQFLNNMIDKTLIERLQGVVKENFVRLPYTEGIKILEEAVKNGHKFEFPVSWGVDLASEHERYLVEHHFKKPVIMIDYPKEIKAFYMKQNADGKTVQGTDVLFPAIGEIIGGSVREESLEKLEKEVAERNIPMKDMWWYLDTRKYGTCPHAGFGLGFERLLLFVTGMSNIRDVIPYPRTPRNAEF